MKKMRKASRRALLISMIGICLFGGLFFIGIKGNILSDLRTFFEEDVIYDADIVGGQAGTNKRTNVLYTDEVIPCGKPIGIYINTKGVLVIDTGEITDENGNECEPASPKVQSGDYILKLNENEIGNKKDLINAIQEAEGNHVDLEILRSDEVIEVRIPRVLTREKDYKLGLWVREDTQGVGMLTFVDENGNFGALGHGINDLDTGELMSIKTGKIFESRVISITKGLKGAPGELVGVISYADSYELGRIDENTTEGIFGSGRDGILDYAMSEGIGKKKIAYKSEVEEGPVSIYCSIDGTPKEYAAEITAIKSNKKNRNKELVIKVTDPELIALTGGIVQGMSGSPILQNDKVVGAVTHVFINDPTKGYGIFIEEMLEN